jgi:hypothetical protein
VIKYRKYTKDGTVQEALHNGEPFASIGKVTGGWRGHLLVYPTVVVQRSTKAETAETLLKEFEKRIY